MEKIKKKETTGKGDGKWLELLSWVHLHDLTWLDVLMFGCERATASLSEAMHSALINYK